MSAPVAQPYQEYVPEPVPPAEPYVAPQPEPEVVEEVKPSRPPMYYFEEVEERRAREREQLAAWYQPVPEPVQPVVNTPSVSAPPVTPTPAVAPVAESVKQATAAASAAALVFSPATGGTPRPQVKEGIGPQLPRPNPRACANPPRAGILWH